MTIEITFTINDTKLKIATYVNDSVKNIIDNLETVVKRECELKVFIYDTDSTNFHYYNFEYSKESELVPRKWLLNNILYSITCGESKLTKNRPDIWRPFVVEFNK